MKVFMLSLLLVLELSAVSPGEIIGKWQSTTQTLNNGTRTIEKEYLHLNEDRTFSMVILVSLQKEDAFIKDLRIEGSGIWKVWNNTLVAVVNKVKVPNAGEVYLISQKSLENLSETFKRRFKNEPIRVMMIESIDKNNMIIFNEKVQKTHYKR